MADSISLESGKRWREFGEQFGWRIYGWNDEWWATFALSDGQLFRIPALARDNINRAIEARAKESADG